MSKAFTKEDSDQEDGADDLELRSLPTKKNYITPQGHARLKEELHELLYKTRPDLTQIISWAAGNGDRSENGDYIYGKRKLREVDRRIRFLTKRLEIAEVIDPLTHTARNKIQFSATVTVQVVSEGPSEGQLKTYSIVGIDEIEPGKGKISWISPLAKVLLNQEMGDIVTFHSPKGEEELEIVKVEYKAII